MICTTYVETLYCPFFENATHTLVQNGYEAINSPSGKGMRVHSRANEYEQLQVVNVQSTIHRAVGYEHWMIDCKRYNALDRALYLNAWCARVSL